MRNVLVAALLASALLLPACGDQGPVADGGNGGTDSGSGNGSDSGSGSGDAGRDAGMMNPDAGGTTSDAGSMDSGATDSGYQVIPRTDWPVFQNPNNNPLLTSVELVTITFAGYPFRTEAESLGDFIVGSEWLTTIGADYGVGLGTHVGKYNFPDYDAGAMATISDLTVESFLQGKISGGQLPAPTAQTLYMVYFPASISVSNFGFGQSCVNFDGYHKGDTNTTPHFAYAVINDCAPGNADELAEVEITASHELAEAATDPFPSPIGTPSFQVRGTSSPWVASQIIAEIGDVCEGQRISVTGPDAGYTFQQIWSTSAAAANQSPCIPVDPARPYFGVSVSPATVQSGAAGSTVDFTVTGWSGGPLAPWDITLYEFGASGLTSFTPTATFPPTTLSNGEAGTLGVGIPSGTAAGAGGVVLIYSQLPNSLIYSAWPVVVTAQ